MEQQEVTYGCVEQEYMGSEEELVGGVPRKGIWKAFKDKKYNQKLIDSYSCFMVSPFQAISNFTGNDIPLQLMQKTFLKMIKEGKFTPGVGGYMEDGMSYAINAYNDYCSDSLKFKTIPLTTENIIAGLESGSPIVTGIHYSNTYFSDEQLDGDAWISKVESIGKSGHCIAIVKINTEKDILVKFVENYFGVVKYDIIGCDFTKFKDLFFKTGLVIYK